MESEPPMMTQDEFFRHLNLQSVHSVRNHYRQALKERLRQSTKQESLKLPTVVKRKKLAVPQTKKPMCNPLESLVSPKSCKMIFGSPKVLQDDIESSHNGDCSTIISTHMSVARKLEMDHHKISPVIEQIFLKPKQTSILQPLYQNCHLLQHPGVQREFQQRAFRSSSSNQDSLLSINGILRINKVDSNRKKVSPAKKQTVFIKRTYVKPNHVSLNKDQSLSTTTNENVCTAEKSYSSKILIQHKRTANDMELDKASLPPMPPVIFSSSSPIKDTITNNNMKNTPSKASSHQAGNSSSPVMKPKKKFPRIRLLGSASVLNNTSCKSDSVKKLSTSNKPKNGCNDIVHLNGTKKLSNSSKNDVQYHIQNRHDSIKKKQKCSTKLVVDLRRDTSSILQSAANKSLLNSLQSQHHHICVVCKKVFSQKRNLDTHMEMHILQNNRQFSCSKCKIYFDDVHEWETHLNKHFHLTPKSAVKCDICNKIFTTKTSMIKHVKNIHPSQMHIMDLAKFVSHSQSRNLPIST